MRAWVAVLVVLAACGGVEAPSPPPPSATAVPDAAPEAVVSREPAGYLGVIIAGTSVDVAPKVEGRLERVFVQVGDRVARGSRLAQMDVRALRAELKLALANLSEARARRRRRARLDPGAISAEELAAISVQVTDRRTRVQQLREALADATLPAPFDGVVGTRYADAGSMVGPGRAVVRLLGGDALGVRFAVPEADGAAFKVRDPVRVTAPGGQGAVRAQVQSVAPEVEPGSRMIFVVATLQRSQSAGRQIPLGMVVRVAPEEPPRAAQEEP